MQKNTKYRGHRLRFFLMFLVVCGCVALVLTTVPAGTLHVFGQRMALLSAGLRQPADTAEQVYGWLTRETAAAPPASTTVTTALTVGEGQSHFVIVPTATGTVKRQEGGGAVLTQTMSAGDTFVQGVAIRNKSGKTVNIADSLSHRPALALVQNSDKPQVLITHTHTTECYMSYDAGFYNPDDASRTTDASRNMVAVGRRVAAQLQALGIGVVHDTAIHDQPYNGAYGHSKAAVETYLKKYPSIRVVLDLHRDAIYSGTTHIKPTVTVEGKSAAQVMVIVGMMNTTSVPNKHTAENLAFGARLQQRLHQTYPGLARPMLLANARYNQQLTNGSLLIEIGSDANTLEEACYTGELLGGVLGNLLQELGA